MGQFVVLGPSLKLPRMNARSLGLIGSSWYACRVCLKSVNRHHQLWARMNVENDGAQGLQATSAAVAGCN
jgi:hypothetical protein